MLASGESKASVVDALMHDLQFPHQEAVEFVDHVADAMRSERRQAGMREVLVGIALAALGAGVTGLTYLLADPGGVFLVLWGLVVWGGFKALMGVSKLLG